MELELGLAPPTAHLRLDDLSCSSDSSSGSGKRSFQETLPLFDDGSSSIGSKKKQQLVGWPPVSSARTRACGGANYVKVKKEGEAIGRKVDLSLHASYDDLIATLARMFPATNNQSEEDETSSSSSTNRVVTYEDGEGDWMLVGDVPWDDFARSAKRLKIMG
ncbi:hypothetical protein PR202_ga03102 [Eleusine coracana subsp. coracana]|uniref:Auxin-responsive protein n=1 Tax=Eleusine coracana subsp. coracana TaxID=191504 RepID=A0AAV5BPG7_ELECO|nr:hypothetical protein QOZ80_2BG0204620 [Eleusine coracana subsp. coracana]GJM87174.1 hypothetical protein PR202_ga03102 [Eleusine coracana subsp. coracana]